MELAPILQPNTHKLLLSCSLGNVPGCLLTPPPPLPTMPRMANSDGHFVGWSLETSCLWSPGWCGVAGTCHPSWEMQGAPEQSQERALHLAKVPAGEHSPRHQPLCREAAPRHCGMWATQDSGVQVPTSTAILPP